MWNDWPRKSSMISDLVSQILIDNSNCYSVKQIEPGRQDRFFFGDCTYSVRTGFADPPKSKLGALAQLIGRALQISPNILFSLYFMLLACLCPIYASEDVKHPQNLPSQLFMFRFIHECGDIKHFMGVLRRYTSQYLCWRYPRASHTLTSHLFAMVTTGDTAGGLQSTYRHDELYIHAPHTCFVQ